MKSERKADLYSGIKRFCNCLQYRMRKGIRMEENKENQEKNQDKPKKRSPRKIIGLLIILVGIGVCAYPFIVQAYNKYQQEKMLEEFREEIKKNQEALSVTPVPTEAVDSAEPTEILKTPTPEPTDVPTTEVTEAPTPTKGAENVEPTEVPATPTPLPTETPTPTPRGNRLNQQEVIGIIEIDAIDLIYPIVEGADHAEMGVAIGHMSETAGIGEIGNCTLAGHRGGYSGPYFEDLDKLKAGDLIRLTDAFGEEYIYEMTESMVVEPTDVWVVEDTGEGKAVLTLLTCEDKGTHRLIVRAYLKEE